MKKTHNDALLEVDWLLQESYKRAVRMMGVTDWSKETSERVHQCEQYQLQIAQLIQKALHS